jgi:hypothetical protein
MTQLENIRGGREIIGDPLLSRAPHVAYLGLFNPTKHWTSLTTWMSRLEKKGYPLLVVDNQSDDNSWSTTVNDIQAVYPNSLFIRNPINLGGFGSLTVNLDLLKNSKWVTTFHQDDIYPTNHLLEHGNLTNSCDKDVAIISSEQESFNSRGARLGYPRAAWLLGNVSNAKSLFLANLKHHTLPFSGATFRVEMLEDISIPWHSTAFPDTEVVLRMLPKWTGLVTSASIVSYLENPISESHSIQDTEKNLGASMSLIRVFNTPNFGKLCRSLEEDEVEVFVREMLVGLSGRISEARAASTVRLVALEAMAQHLGPNATIAKELESIYRSIGAIASTTLLHRLHSFTGTESTPPHESCTAFDSQTQPNQPGNKATTFIKQVLARFLGLLPRNARKFLVKSTLGVFHKLHIKTKWDFPLQ